MSLITVSSDFGSGGEKIAQKVSEVLGIDFYDDQKIQEKAISMGVSSKDLDGLDEKAPRLFDRLFTNKHAKYLDLLGSVIYDISSKGEGVIVGHGAHAFLQDFNCALHILIHASEETRSKWLSKEQNISEEAAIKLVRKMDNNLREFVQYAFSRDWKDPSGYDMVFNLDKLGPEWAAKLTVELAKSDEIKTCSLKALEEMSLSSLKRKVDVAMIENKMSSIFNKIIVDVTVGGKVHLSGWAYNEDEIKTVVALVKDVPGVSEVTSELKVMPTQYTHT